LYKVFLVEDEIVTREGIRDNVNWRRAGFEFCGEAPDGEIALPLIETSQPDVLITDIKMPFMDGLQLSKIVRERMPWVKIIILSGHDEFHYAQEAIKMGVCEYLLKPLSAADLDRVLNKIARSIEQERKEQESLQRLKDQVEDNLGLLRERFLLRLIMGGISSTEAIEQSHQLGLDVVAQYYLVILIKIELCAESQPFDYHAYRQVEQIIREYVDNHRGVFLMNKDLEEVVLLIKGDDSCQLDQESAILRDQIKREVEGMTHCQLKIGTGGPQHRLGEIHHSFAEALVRLKDSGGEYPEFAGSVQVDSIEHLKLNQTALEHFLRSGTAHDFDLFFDSYLQQIGEVALRFQLVKHYVFVEVMLTAAQFVSDLGGDVDEVFPELHQFGVLLANTNKIVQIKQEINRILSSALSFRDRQLSRQRKMMIHQARNYIEEHFTDAELSLADVAAHVNLSPSHFSVVFAQEAGETFKDYLIKLRLARAKELLRTTNLKCAEVAYKSGYNDPHYFSTIFKKNAGVSPQRYRNQPQLQEKERK
jgi:two-component system response regulator YesN